MEVLCPLKYCDGHHALKVDRAGKSFVFCPVGQTSSWFRSELAAEWLARQNGGPIRANPDTTEEPIAARPLTVQEQRAASAGFEDAPSAAPTRSADELSPIWKKLGLGLGDNEHEPGFCPGCRAVIRVGESPCPKCGADIDWSE